MRRSIAAACFTASVFWPLESALSWPDGAGVPTGSWKVVKAQSTPWPDDFTELHFDGILERVEYMSELNLDLVPGVFKGSWDVVEAHPVPWADVMSRGPLFVKEITHSRIVFTRDSVEGPRIFDNCKNPSYEIVEGLPPEYLFQSALMNPEITADTDPLIIAKKLGHDGSQIIRLAVRCSHRNISIDFDLLAKDLAIFVFENMIYSMRRVKP